MRRRLFWPALTAAAMLALTLGLGVWQLQRLTWKRELLSEIGRGENAAPVRLPDEPAPFLRVWTEGVFLPQVARYGAEVRAAPGGVMMGAHLLAALRRAGGQTIIVDRGWAPLTFDSAPPSGRVRIEGYVRPPEHTPRFGTDDDVPARRFFALNPAKIGLSMGLGPVAPFTLVAMGESHGLPAQATALPRPPNDHLTYAITWFSLAAALVVVFSLFVRQTLAKDSKP